MIFYSLLKLKLCKIITYANNLYDAATGADAVLLVTEWKDFRLPNWNELRKIMRGNIIIDGRNIFDSIIHYRSLWVCFWK